ncbi:MAG: hypothetical protein MJZ92_00175 [Paludibacteraceae bacterium]|nr:hypothetical protein [Paludibacteraceae bacterium]
MKKFFLALMAVAAIAIAGCNKSINDPEPPENKEEVRGIYPPSEDSTVVIVNDEVPDDGK